VAQTTGIVLAVGAVTLVNEAVFAPLLGQAVAINWRIVPATAGLALALAALERIAPGFAMGLAWLSLFTAAVVPLGNAPTPLQNASRVLGYGTKVVQ
jgi:hypothetical protein